MAIVGSNVRVEIESIQGTALEVTGITKANPGVATSAAHGLANGDIVVFDIAGGMVELNGQACRVANVATNTFELEGINTTDYSTFTAGDAYEITAFSTFAAAQSISMPSPTPAKLDTTTLIDKVKQYTYGLPDAPDGSITALFNPGGTAEALITAATNSNSPLVFRITYSTGQKSVFNANVSGGAGFDMQGNAVATSTVAFTPVGQVIHYAN
jgi:hypothetical protein